MKEARFSVAFIRNVFFYAASRGVSVTTLCEHARIPQALLDQPDEMVSGHFISRAWDAAIAATGDEDLGLHLGESVHPAALGLLGFAMLSCDSLAAALDKMRRYWNLLSDASSIVIEQEGPAVKLELRVHDLPGNALLEARHGAESSLSAILAICHFLTGQRPHPLRVCSAYPQPRNTAEYLRIFGRQVEFDAGENSIRIPSQTLDGRVLHSNAQLLAGFERQIANRLAPVAANTRDIVRQEAAKYLRGDTPELAVVARGLGKSERALQRDLQAAGTSFRQVIEELRRDLAMDYLTGSEHSIADISFLLGFSEASAFHRSFRRWTGVTPQAYRRGDRS